MPENKKENTIGYEDPFEAIFALNLGDFVAENLLSKELLSKISSKMNISPEDRVDRLKEQLKEIVSIYSIGNTLNLLGFEGDDGFLLYDSIAITIAQMLGMDSCNIFLKPDMLPVVHKDKTKQLILFGTSSKEKLRDFGYSYNHKELSTKSFIDRKTLCISNIKKNPYWKPSKELDEGKAVTFLSTPMISGRDAIGIINLYSFKEIDISEANIKLLESIAAIFSLSIKLQEQIEEANILIAGEESTDAMLTRSRAQLTASIADLGFEQERFVRSLAEAVDAKSEFTKEHSQNVAELARDICRHLELNEKTIDLIYYAGLLKNIGKIIIPKEVFSKKNLSDEDWRVLQDHPNIGVDLLMKVNFLSEVVPYINYYRERYDGKGQPEGLSGLSIPLGSRIIAVADAFQAMISDRSYRDQFEVNKALEMMEKEAGSKWDPVVVEALVALKR